MSITIVTIARNEQRYLEEFFIYYKEIFGCERILFYDDSDDDVQKNICYHYRDYVTHIPWLGKGHKESHNHAREICETEFIGYFDFDEFLVLKKHDCINDYLQEIFIKNRAIVFFNWRIFTPMGYTYDPDELVTTAYTQC